MKAGEMAGGTGEPGAGLLESGMHPDPIRQFSEWFRHATENGVDTPEAMALATADARGHPSARYVLMKGFDERGFVFFTHTVSVKGRQLAENPLAALVFYWAPLRRQVRVEGGVERVGDAEADAYFASRPYGSRVSAWVAPQSSVVAGRDYIERRYAEIEGRFAGGTVPRPETWSGFRVRPESVEFWQSRESRLHDRVRYRRGPGDTWVRERLAP